MKKNMASHWWVVLKGEILLHFSDNFGYASLALHSKWKIGCFVETSCRGQAPTISVNGCSPHPHPVAGFVTSNKHHSFRKRFNELRRSYKCWHIIKCKKKKPQNYILNISMDLMGHMWSFGKTSNLWIEDKSLPEHSLSLPINSNNE